MANPSPNKKKPAPTASELKKKYQLGVIRRAMAQGLSITAANTVAGVAEPTSRRWRREGLPKRVGRKFKRNAEVTRKVVKLAKAVRRRKGRVIPAYPSARRIAVALLKYGMVACPQTVRRYLRKAGMRCLVRPRHPNIRNRAKRLEFANAWFNSRLTSKLMFSDEHWISTNDATLRTMYVARDAVPIPRDNQRRHNIPTYQIWAAIGVGWRSELVFFPKTDDSSRVRRGFRLNQSSYVQLCLQPHLRALARKGYIFMHDGAACHRARSVTTWMRDNGITVMTGFPASSPDLNPIEKLWKHLDECISELQPTNDEELKTYAIRAWKAIPQRTIDNHVRSFKSAVAGVVENQGL